MNDNNCGLNLNTWVYWAPFNFSNSRIGIRRQKTWTWMEIQWKVQTQHMKSLFWSERTGESELHFGLYTRTAMRACVCVSVCMCSFLFVFASNCLCRGSPPSTPRWHDIIHSQDVYSNKRRLSLPVHSLKAPEQNADPASDSCQRTGEHERVWVWGCCVVTTAGQVV